MPRRLSHPIARGSVWSLFAGLLLISVLPTGAFGQNPPNVVEPRLQLRAGTSRVVYERAKGEDIYMDLGIHVASVDAPFEIRLSREDYLQEIEVRQMLSRPNGDHEERPLPTDVMAGWSGLDDFFHATIRDKEGEAVVEMTADFCPNSYDMQRVNDEGPQTPRYPTSCGIGPFTRGMVWGIEEGWAARVYELGQDPIRLRAGLYTVTTEIAPRYVEMFSLEPAVATAVVEFKVKTVKWDEYPPGKPPLPARSVSWSDEPARTSVPTIEPDPETLPDLVPLPAWSISVTKGKTKARLNFSATVAVQGASSLVVEGFRRPGEDVMDAFQYFYSDGDVVGRAPVGTMEYDYRDGHFHWHFQQFARYSLLNADQSEIALSRKESFCLAATDAIDLLIPGADWRVENSDLSTACGSQDSLWVREILPLGWGDTYSQSLPGQSFNITDLPNGKYYIAVEANPEGLLHEPSVANNVELREIYLRGKGLDRRVVVPPWNGIDTEGNSGGGSGVLGHH